MLTKILVYSLLLLQLAFNAAVITSIKLIKPEYTNSTDSDIIILKDETTFDLTGFREKTIHRKVLLKILSKHGAESFDSLALPESFDIGENRELWQQGRKTRIKIPYIYNFVVKDFKMTRYDSLGNKTAFSFKLKYCHSRWINSTGAFENDDIPTYYFKCHKNDLLEYEYTATYEPHYGNDIVYFNDKYPKKQAIYSFRYFILPGESKMKFILASNIPDSLQHTQIEDHNDAIKFAISSFTLGYLRGINHFINARPGARLPYVYFNINYTIKLFNNRYFSVANLPDYSWAGVLEDNQKKWYTKFPNDIRKFLRQFSDSSTKVSPSKLLAEIVDTLNQYTYYSENDLMYNRPALFNLYSSEHLLKHRIIEANMPLIYRSILKEEELPFFICNLEDKRLGEANPLIRNRSYENILFALFVNDTLTYIVPRYNGLKYYPNELPFYYEGTTAALFPSSYVKIKGKAIGAGFRFVRTPQSNFDNNYRSEITDVKITSNNLQLNTSEKISGQFSTLLRPLYLGGNIDSSVNKHYFKKCSDKPGGIETLLKLKKQSEFFPFQCDFHIQQKILQKTNSIKIGDWFFFPLDSAFIGNLPTHDYFFDFPFSDIYDFNLIPEANNKILIEGALPASIENDFFELNTQIEQYENGIKIKVVNKVKSYFVPLSSISLLGEYTSALQQLKRLQLKCN